ncbi:1,6-anhydro-N-acetylmuramyl-L-alanine amidase AmpD [Pseudoteredinibacter isoporae]|uniref:1,6-anhydro-N-acetylmuramyl-L-alanine amidase AmpD n=1 Tax=Pseudoteredinibacter isoporae TaxID=570281 RepID=A0A7X0JRF3_9GAMM|nr:1,6-anhydro-N-acetylmuramyl-L-alanine amidase AmpD [Pseudoteredinibacter isoporae]MBB6520918.1 AmpD protein [Pseudoteredinibacter isoporae]NHO86483.1 1,6-anhydro-N-acetylmuramyl-L-alanine amidase AmpD [Pseudoteredinibacter isoporae]NIB25065.1 1,6-anhydro-N-acetylmuramyl-L-alanine amidase AmpD [Pseudoteredinibacter isoporae]
MKDNETGWLHHIRACPSPNFNQRPDISDISLLVIHNISLPPGEFGAKYIEDFFCNQLDCTAHDYFETIAGLEVSAHFLIDRKGDITQFVDIFERAWHAGKSCFAGRENCNDFSIGIELEGCDDQTYTNVQYQALARLSLELVECCPKIVQQDGGVVSGNASNMSGFNICGHSDIAPGRKTDPGPCFDWARYENEFRQLFTLAGDKSGN